MISENKMFLALVILIYENIDAKLCRICLSTLKEVAEEEINNTIIKFMKDFNYKQIYCKGNKFKCNISS